MDLSSKDLCHLSSFSFTSYSSQPITMNSDFIQNVMQNQLQANQQNRQAELAALPSIPDSYDRAYLIDMMGYGTAAEQFIGSDARLQALEYTHQYGDVTCGDGDSRSHEIDANMYNAWTYQLQALSNFHQAKMSAGGMMLEPNKTGISWTIFLLTQEIKALKKGSDPSGMAEAAYTAKAQAEAAAQDCHAASLRAAACAESSEGTSLMTEVHALRQAQAEAQMKGAQLDEQLAQLAS